MKNIGIWLYRYIVMHMDHMLHDMLAMLDAMMPEPVSRPALQRVRTTSHQALTISASEAIF